MTPWIAATSPAKPRRPLLRRAALGALRAACGLVGLGAGLWFSVHEVPGFAPAMAEGLRATVGARFVAWAEDTAYGAADSVKRTVLADSAPKTYWEAAEEAVPRGPGAGEAMTRPASARTDTLAPAIFPPPRFQPPFANVATPADGVWVHLSRAPEQHRDGDPAGPAMVKAIVHPDPKRSFAAVAVVAIDLSRIDLTLVAGTDEPKSAKVPPSERVGRVPASKYSSLIAVFNGGFRAEHGHYGMMIGGSTFLEPRELACTVGLFEDGRVDIGTYARVKHKVGAMTAYRQTPPCLVEEGITNSSLSEYTRNWGATVSGETVIRRSAIGVDASGRVLFYGLGDAVTARALAQAMRAVGAKSAAQLDVNHAYPRFLMFRREGGTAPRAREGLIPDLKWVSTEYTDEASLRDFFYLTWKRP